MTTIKSYTDIEQSKKLAEILPLESADYHYIAQGQESYFYPYSLSNDVVEQYNGDIKYIPCWSLAALYGILPNNEKESTNLSRGGWKIKPPEYIDNWWCEYEDDSHIKDFTVSADNPVDACCEIIEKLHERNLL